MECRNATYNRNQGFTIGDGTVFGTVLAINPNQLLLVDHTLTVQPDAVLFVSSPLSVGGFAGLGGSLENQGDLVLANTTVSGPVTNHAGANITAIGDVTFNHLVSGPGGFFGPGTITFAGGMAPGASPAEVTFESGAVFDPLNTLFIEIGGTASGTQYDTLSLGGAVTLGGTLDVELINGFAPQSGDLFDIITADGGVVGTFTTELLPTLAGNLVWDVIYGANAVSLLAVLPGDYNFNGTVDAADYVVWRDAMGTQAEYDVWRAHFGQTAAGSGSAAARGSERAVPEPATLPLLAAILALHTTRRKKRVRIVLMKDHERHRRNGKSVDFARTEMFSDKQSI